MVKDYLKRSLGVVLAILATVLVLKAHPFRHFGAHYALNHWGSAVLLLIVLAVVVGLVFALIKARHNVHVLVFVMMPLMCALTALAVVFTLKPPLFHEFISWIETGAAAGILGVIWLAIIVAVLWIIWSLPVRGAVFGRRSSAPVSAPPSYRPASGSAPRTYTPAPPAPGMPVWPTSVPPAPTSGTAPSAPVRPVSAPPAHASRTRRRPRLNGPARFVIVLMATIATPFIYDAAATMLLRHDDRPWIGWLLAIPVLLGTSFAFFWPRTPEPSATPAAP